MHHSANTGPGRAWHACILIGALAFFWTSGCLAAGLDSGPWPMFHRSAAHDGRSPVPFLASSQLLWSESLSDTVEFSSPVIDRNGNIYLGDIGKEIWAFQPSGDTLWTYKSGGNIRRSTPAIADDGTIYFGSNDGNLYALNPDGSFKWASPTGGAVKTSPAIGSDGRIYVGSDDANLWAFFPDGSVDWTFPAGDTIRSSPALVGDTLVVFGSNDGFIYAVNTDGTPAWSAATGGPVKASPARGQGGDIIVGSYDGFLYSIRHHGSLNWALFVGEELKSSPAIGQTGKIYLGVDKDLHCYRDEGVLSWTFATSAPIVSSPAVTPDLESEDEIVVFGSDDGKIYAARRPGEEVWSYEVGWPVRSSPAMGQAGLLYIGAMDGKLYAFQGDATSVDEAPFQEDVRLVVGPNPFTSSAGLWFRLEQSESDDPGSLRIYDAAGRLVRSLALSPARPVLWNGFDDEGRHLPSGVYLYRWVKDGASASGSIVRLR